MALSTLPAAAQTADGPLERIGDYSQNAEWGDGFDVSVPGAAAVASERPTISHETSTYMAIAITRYMAIARMGGWTAVPSEGKPLRIGMRDDRVAALRQRLQMSGDLAQSAGSSEVFDSYVDAAVRRFQARHGLTPDGVVGASTIEAMNVPVETRLTQLQANLRRLDDMPRDLGDSYVMVNIPGAEIEAVENGFVRSRHTAVVGKIDRQTPVLSSQIHEINFNPHWTVPVSIIRRDLIPIMKKEPDYLARNNIRIFDWQDNELDWTQIDWNSDEATQYLFRQDPGEINSLGSVKINFHNKYQVYMHDTPAKNLFGDDYRFQSSGCVRVQNVRELVTWLLQSTTPEWDRARVDGVIRSGAREDVRLKARVPVHFVYVTAWANADGVVHFREDIYENDVELAGLFGGAQAYGTRGVY